MRLASEGRKNVPRISEFFGIQQTILRQSYPDYFVPVTTS